MCDKGFKMGCWIILDYKRESALILCKDVAEKVAYQVGLAPLDVHIPREEGSHGIVPRDTHDSGETPSQTHVMFCGCSEQASSCHVRSASGGGNDTQVRRKAWMRRRTQKELTSRERLEKKKGVVRPRVPSSSMMVWTRRSASSRPRTRWWKYEM